MKAAKFLVLIAGVIGVLSFFLPLVSIKVDGTRATVSGFRAVRGIESTSQVVDGVDENVAKIADRSAEFRAAKASLNGGDSSIKTAILVVFAPALLLAVIGGVAVSRKKLGRLGGVGATLLGLVTLGLAAILNSAANDAAASGAPDPRGIAMYLLFATGILAAVGGLGALVKPDRGVAA